VAVAGGIAISPGGAAVGASLAYNFIGGSFDAANPNVIDRNTTATDQIPAYIDNSAVHARGNPTVATGLPAPTPPREPANLAPNTTTFDPPTKVSTAADTIDVGSNSGFTTGQPIVYSRGGPGNTAIGGLTDGTTYYVIVPANDTTHIKLARTADDANSGR